MKKSRRDAALTRPLANPLVQRKNAHIAACLDDAVDLQRNSFSAYKIRYKALPEIRLDDVSTQTEFAGKRIAAPLVISSMTGGVGEEIERINRNLAEGAEELQIPLGLGSMKVLLKHPEAASSFAIRDVAPTIPVIANLGLVSFNYDLTYDDIGRIQELVQPDVFGIHLNALQEVIQEGGDTDFRGLTDHLAEILRRCPIPVFVKECGGGIAPDLVQKLARMGVHYIDVSGNDGTSWSAVEGRLSQDPSLGELFKDFGLPTSWIMENLDFAAIGLTRIVASGGIRDGIQAAKALALGAHYVSVARPFLIAAMESSEAVVAMGRRLIQELRTAMFLAGVTRIGELDRSLLIGPIDESNP